MLRQKKLAVLVVGALMALSLLAVAGSASAAPPEPIPFPTDTVRGVCDFPVLVESTGRSKVIESPNGDTLFKNPGLRVTLTNLEDQTHQVTYVDSGTIRVTELEGGGLLLVATGRNVLYGEGIGMFLAIGRFSTVIDEEGNFTPLMGHGKLIDVCTRLA